MKQHDGKHPGWCRKCSRRTYRKSGLCRICDPAAVTSEGLRKQKPGPARLAPDPAVWPEDYLLLCLEELKRRHAARHAAIKSLMRDIQEAA